MTRTKHCKACFQVFTTERRDARTCSPRCRKRLERTRKFVVSDVRYTNRSGEHQNGTALSAMPASARRVGKAVLSIAVVLAIVRPV